MKYNYQKFANKEYDLVHSSGIKSGEKIQDFSFLTLNGETNFYLTLHTNQ